MLITGYKRQEYTLGFIYRRHKYTVCFTYLNLLIMLQSLWRYKVLYNDCKLQ